MSTGCWEVGHFSRNVLRLMRGSYEDASARRDFCTNLPRLNGGDGQCFGSETLSCSTVFCCSQGQILLQLHLLSTMVVKYGCLA